MRRLQVGGWRNQPILVAITLARADNLRKKYRAILGLCRLFRLRKWRHNGKSINNSVPRAPIFMSGQVPPRVEAGRAGGKPEAAQGEFGHVSLSGGALFEATFFAAPVPMCVLDTVKGSVVTANGAWLGMAGVEMETALREGLSAFGPSFAEKWATFSAGDETADMGSVEFLPHTPGSPIRRVGLKVTPITQGGQSLRLLTAIEETWERVASLPDAVQRFDDLVQANAMLRQQVLMHPAIERLARVGHWTTVGETSELAWSPGLYEVAGLPRKASISREEARAGLHPDDRAAWLQARENLDGRDFEYRWTRPNGDLRWLRTRMGRTELPGQAVLAFGVVQDVTEERKVEIALATELRFVNNIADHVPGAIYRARRAPDGTPSVSFISAAVTAVLGVNAEAVMADQRLFFSRILPEDLPGLLKSLDRTCEDLSVLRATFRADIPARGRRWIQAEATTQRDADGATVWHGFITDVTDHLVAAQSLERQHRMLQSVQKSQAIFIELEDKRKAFEDLLASLLSVTESSFGFVGEVLFDAKEQPYLRMQAITDIAWDDATRKALEAAGEQGVEFHNLGTLFGHALRTGETVISNEPKNDHRAGGLPPGHPPLNSFLGVPILLAGKLIAMVGLANKPEGFDASDVAFLQPLLGTVRELVMASRAHAERRRARLQFQATSALLAEKTAALQLTFDTINQGLTMVDAAGRVRFYNQRTLELLDLPESAYQDQPLHTDIFKIQLARGDFGVGLKALPPEARAYVLGEIQVSPPHYVRRTPQGAMLEVLTRQLPDGGFVRTYTDVTSYFNTQEALREERQRLQWVLEATRPGIWEVNLETGETQYNDRWLEMLGYVASELQPRNLDTWQNMVHPEDLPRAMRMRKAHLEGDLPYYECDMRMRHKRGHWLWVNNRGRVHRRDEKGRALYMSGTLLDIHDRVTAQEEVRSLNASLERRVIERTAELERSMKDMEAISYSIAHDLRAPLRSVNGFASLIAEEDNERLSPESRRMFERIANSSRNMGQMITDMLELLRVVRVDLDAVPVDMNALAHAVSETLLPSVPHALIGIKPLPRVLGDATLLRQVLVNLMDNALKYSKHLPQPELVLGYDERQRAFYLRDNGMGFDMARAGKLFGLFQRMHAGSDVPGTGVGLAIVARIVERHGGRIWAEATPHQGATFWWTLPRG